MASLGEWKTTCFPLIQISPSSGLYIPYNCFISVVLPAPFSPTIPWMEFFLTEIVIWLLATVPGKAFTISFSRTASSMEHPFSFPADFCEPTAAWPGRLLSKTYVMASRPAIPGWQSLPRMRAWTSPQSPRI